MFTWICPQCGREVPPAYTECPDCTKSTQTVTLAAPPPSSVTILLPEKEEPAAEVPPEVKPLAPPIDRRPAPSLAPVSIPQAPKRGFPVWLAFVLSAIAIAATMGAVYWAVNYAHGGGSGSAAAVASPAAKPSAAASALQKFIEVSSVRFLEDPKDKEKVIVKFVLTNHSEAELNGLAGNVAIWASTGRSEEDAEGSFEFKTDVKGMESKELTAPLIGKKKIYELPDWQNMTNDVQITAPSS